MINAKKSLQVKLVELPELLMIGIPVNVSYKHGDFSKIGRNKEEFKRRLAEIPNAVNPAEFYAPWYNCEVMFTYFYCLQVSSLEHIPEGMMGFSIPAHNYLFVEYDGVYPFDPDPYEAIHQYRDENDIKVNKEAMILEKFTFADEGQDGRVVVEIYGPVE